MNAKSLIVGALLIAPAIGLAAGQAISTEPLDEATDVMDTLPERPTISITTSATPAGRRLPDHYAMETPEGRVEVHELALRGRYADRRQQVESWRPEVEENLTVVEGGQESYALDPGEIAPSHSRSDKRFQAPAPEAPHETEQAETHTDDAYLARTTKDDPANTVPEPRIANMRVIDVESEFAFKR
jgi:hypothetical protein